MFEKEDLLKLNNQGFIPGPNETESSFLKRVTFTKKLFEDPNNFFEEKGHLPPFKLNDKLKSPDREWAKSSLLNCFGISASHFSAYFNDEKLRAFQGAATWILDIDKISLPILQIRKRLKKGVFLWIYELEDILAHELAHFARAGFEEPKYEEFFAYFTSSRMFRRIFGPIVISSKEIILFVVFLFFALSNQYLGMIFNHKMFDVLFLIFSYLTSKMIFLGFIRLTIRRFIFNRCYKKVFSFFKEKEKTMSVMFRLTDKEIKDFSKNKVDYIKKYVQEQKNKSLRWQVIYTAYFENVI